MKKPEIFEILITDDRNFSDDNFSKGFNRQVLIVAKNEKRNTSGIIKLHSLGKTEEEKEKRRKKEDRGILLKIYTNKEVYAENILIIKTVQGKSIGPKYNYNNGEGFVRKRKKVSLQYQQSLLKHVFENKKQKNITKHNIEKSNELNK